MRLISFEGIDGSGKSTALEEVARIFDNYNLSYIVTKEPKGVFRDIILDPDNRYNLNEMARMFLYQADRAIHTDYLKSIPDDTTVLCDRGLMSTLVYQAITTNTNISDLMNISLMACNKRVPNLIVLLHASTEIARQRINKRNETKNYFDLKGDSFFKKIQAQYEQVSQYLEYHHNIKVVKINTDNSTIEQTSGEIFDILDRRYNLTNRMK